MYHHVYVFVKDVKDAIKTWKELVLRLCWRSKRVIA